MLILRSATIGRWFEALTRSQQLSCMRLHDQGLLARDPQHSHRFTACPKGREFIIERDAMAAGAM